MNNIIKDKHKVIEETIELTKKVKDENQQLFIIGGVLTATDKIIDSEYAKTVREWIKMTKIDRIYEQEKQEAMEKVKNETIQKTKKEDAIKFAITLIELGHTNDIIIAKTGLSIEEVMYLRGQGQMKSAY